MKFSSAYSTEEDSIQAGQETCEKIREELDSSPDLAMVFVSPHHKDQLETIIDDIHSSLDPNHLLGTMGENIAATGREIEGTPAISLWASSMPDVQILTSHLNYEQTPEGGAFTGWPDDLSYPWPENSVLLLLAEPFTFPAEALLTRINEDHDEPTVMGGITSGARERGENRLILDGELVNEGAVIAHLSGNLNVKPVVSQGCKPIGEEFVVTNSKKNAIFELGGEPAIVQFKHLYEDLPEHLQESVRRGLLLGIVMNERQDSFNRGDFLIRNVLGIDEESGAFAVGGEVQTGQTIQFQVRDAEAANEDLRTLLENVRDSSDRQVESGLMFTCNGRGTNMFSKPNHDAGVVQEMFGDIPLAGFFCQGEIGPVGRKNFLHGFTTSLALFQQNND